LGGGEKIATARFRPEEDSKHQLVWPDCRHTWVYILSLRAEGDKTPLALPLAPVPGHQALGFGRRRGYVGILTICNRL
jgi:hypothetical protein